MTHPLRAALRSPDAEVRRAACLAAASDPEAHTLLEALCERLDDPERGVARAAADAMGLLHRTLPGCPSLLRRAMEHDQPPRRRFAAAWACTRLSPPEPAQIPALVEALDLPDGDLRWAAARLLVEMARLHAEAHALLLALPVGDPRARVRRMAIHALRDLAPDDRRLASTLEAALDDSDAQVRRAAAMTLASLVDPPLALLARLRRCVEEDADPALRRLAALCLAACAERDERVASPEFREALQRAAQTKGDAVLARIAREALDRMDSATRARRT